MNKLIAASVLAASLAMVSASAQTAEELLQKGIRIQQTDGDADGAIQVYRQVLASSGTARSLAAEAQTQIISALLQKGDLAQAGQEFGKLARDYRDQEPFVSSMAEHLRASAQNGLTLLLGDFHDRKYHHYWTGVELTMPSGWSFKTQKPDEGNWDRVDFGCDIPTSAFVTLQRDATPAEDIAGRLQQRYKYKITVQRQADAGYRKYHVRPESVQTRTVGDQPALSAVADYTNAAGDPMSEYLVFVHSEKTMVFFSVTAAASSFATVQSRFEPMILTAQVP